MHETLNYCDDNMLLDKYRSLIAKLAVRDLSKVLSLTFVDFLNGPEFSDSTFTGHLQIAGLAVFRDELSGVFYEVSFGTTLSPGGCFHPYEFSKEEISPGDDFFDLPFPFADKGGDHDGE